MSAKRQELHYMFIQTFIECFGVSEHSERIMILDNARSWQAPIRLCMTDHALFSILESQCENHNWLYNYCMLSLCIQPAAFCKIYCCHTLTAGHHINSVRQTVWYHSHKLAQNRLWGNRRGWEKASVERETVERRRESLKESVFTGVQASPPNKNSFHVSSLPTCPYTNVYGGRLTHLMMSFP